MGYLSDGDGVSLVFLPARAANVSVFFASLASFSALAMLVRAGLMLDMSGGKAVLVIFLAIVFLFWASTGLILAYARWLPPPDSRLWQFVASTTSYLSALWIICFALTVALSMELLVPLISCDDAKPSCPIGVGSIAIQTLCVLLVALLLNLVLAVFVTFDLRNSRHSANVLILRAEMQQRRRKAHLGPQQAGWAATSPLLLESALSSEEEAPPKPPTKQERAQQKDWIVDAFLARAKEPAAVLPSSFSPPSVHPYSYTQALPLPRTTAPALVSTLYRPAQPPFPSPPRSTDALDVPALFSMDKPRSHSRRRSASRYSHRHHSDGSGEDEGRSHSKSREKRGRSRHRRAVEAEEEDRAEEEDDEENTEAGTDPDDERREEFRRKRAEAKAAGAADADRAERRRRRHLRLKKLEKEQKKLEQEEEAEDGGEEKSAEKGKRKKRNGGEDKDGTVGEETPSEGDTDDNEGQQKPSVSSERRSRSRKRDDTDDEKDGEETPSTSYSPGHSSRSHHHGSSSAARRRRSRKHESSHSGRHSPHSTSRSASRRRRHSRDGRANLSARDKEKLTAMAKVQETSGTMRDAASATVPTAGDA